MGSSKGFWGIWEQSLGQVKYKEGADPSHVSGWRPAGGAFLVCVLRVGVMASSRTAPPHLLSCSLKCQLDCPCVWSQVDVSGGGAEEGPR